MEMTSPAAMLATEAIRPLKRIEYERLAAEGFFEDEKVELLFGVVVKMAPLDPSHNSSVHQVQMALLRQVGERALTRCQSSFAASEDSEPQPDVFVIPNGDYWHENPSRAYLVVEVAFSSHRRDRGPKALLYSLSQVDEYWIVDVVTGTVEVYRDPHEGTWQSKSTHHRGDVIAMRAFPDVRVAVSEMVPPVTA